MGEQNELPFPYEFEELKPEEKALINSTLGYIPAPYIRLGPKGFKVYKPYKKDAANIYNMPLRPTDVFVASYQRSGTTLTQELVWLIANDLDYEKAIEIPLTHRYSYLDGFMAIDKETIEEYADVIAKIEKNFDREKFLRTIRNVATPVTPLLAAAPLTSTRFIKTHLPMSLLPPKLLDTAKVVYVARDPRDVAVSCYHHARLFKRSFCSDFKDFWNIFRRDLYIPAPYIRLGPKGFKVYEPYKKDAANIYNMPLRPTDVFVASYQRSGTTLTQELVWLIANDLDYEKAIEIPLTHRYSYLDGFMAIDKETIEEYADVIAKIEKNFDREKFLRTIRNVATPVTPLLAAAPLTSTRFIKTHLPMSLLPPKLLDTAKVVYVARDPRDVAVSCYHHARLFKRSFCSDFKDFWNIFRRDLFSRMPFFEHVKEAWEKRDDPNMLFLFYEDLIKDLPASIRRVTDFFGKQLNQEQMNRLCDHLSFENFKNNKSVNYEDMRETGILAKGETFVRKGDTGGWRAYFDEEMAQQADQWIKENLRNSDLRYPHMEK